MSKIVAIIGRPNVGKSTLFNRLIGSRKAIVEDRPGVTRDRIYGRCEWEGRPLHIIDTGGFDPSPEDPLLVIMKNQVEMALEEADAAIFLLDLKVGLSPVDEEIHRMLVKWNRNIYYAVNKVDGPEKEPLANEFYALGVEQLYFITATHGHGVATLMDAIVADWPEEEPHQQEDPDTIRLTVVGRPNVGKSTLINWIVGKERLLTSDMAGTTRDSVDTQWEAEDGQRYLMVDTAGMRKKKAVKDSVEYYSIVRGIRSIERAQVVLLLVDGFLGMQEQDARIAKLAEDRGKAIIIVFNKWDLVEKDTKTAAAYTKRVEETFPSLKYAPTAFTCALTGKGVHRLFPIIKRVKENWERRIPTSQFTRFVEEAVERNPPPMVKHRRARFYFSTQADTAPPTFVFQVNQAKSIPATYKRYLLNRIRDKYGFEGTPIRMYFRNKKKGKDGE